MAELSKVLIVGAGGLIGSELDFGIKVPHEEMDVTRTESIINALDKYKPEAVLNLASINLRECHKNPYLSNKVNVLGAYNLAIETKKRNIPIIMISSGAVFGGRPEDEFDEENIPDPKNMYGQTKYIAEIIIGKENPKSIIVRTGWLFGFRKKRNFFNKMVDAAALGDELVATHDQMGSFTYVMDFINELKKIITDEKYGIYHVVNSGKASALDLAETIIHKLESKSKINKISIEESEKDGILRSRSEVLASGKVKMRDWKLAINEHIEKTMKMSS